MQKESDPSLSIVATVYNDAPLVSLLVAEIKANVETLVPSYEIILVNDCSTDTTEEAVSGECRGDSRVKGINLSRNFGQQIAVSAGVAHAAGKYVVVMDGDLQNPPSAIKELYATVQEGYDIVYTHSTRRNNPFDALTSRMFWWTMSHVFGVSMIPNQLMLRIMTREFAQYFTCYRERSRFVAGITHDIGMKYTVIAIDNQEREMGKGHYNVISRLDLFIDIALDYAKRPLNWLIYAGGLTCMATTIALLHRAYLNIFHNVDAGITSVLTAILCLGGLVVLLLGIVARYLASIYAEVKDRPLYFIRGKMNL